MPSGALMQIITNYSGENIWINENPEITFFKILFKRHTPFYSELIPVFFNTKPDFSKNLVATLPRSGDLLGQLYLVFQIPETNVKYPDNPLREIADYIYSINLPPNDHIFEYIVPTVQLYELLLFLENIPKKINSQPNPVSYTYSFNIQDSLLIFDNLVDNLFFKKLINNQDIIDTIKIKNSLENYISFNLDNSNIGKYITLETTCPERQKLYSILSDFDFSFNYNVSLINSVMLAIDKLFRTVPLIYIKPFSFQTSLSSKIIYSATDYYNLNNNYSTIFDTNTSEFFYIKTQSFPLEPSEFSPFIYTSLQDNIKDNKYLNYFNLQADSYFNIINYQIEETFDEYSNLFTTTQNLFYNQSPNLANIFNLKIIDTYFQYQNESRISNVLNIAVWYFYYFSYIIYEFKSKSFYDFLINRGINKSNAIYIYYSISLLKYNLESLMNNISDLVNQLYSYSFSYDSSDSLINYSISTFNKIIDNININTDILGITIILHRNQIPPIDEISDYIFNTIKLITPTKIIDYLDRYIPELNSVDIPFCNDIIYDYFASLFNLTKQAYNDMGFSETVTLYPINNNFVNNFWSEFFVNNQIILDQMKFYNIIELINKSQTDNFYYNVLLNKTNLDNILGDDMLEFISNLFLDRKKSQISGFYYKENNRKIVINLENTINNLQFSALHSDIQIDPDLRKVLYRNSILSSYDTIEVSNYNFFRLNSCIYDRTNYSISNVDDFEIALYGSLTIVMNKLSFVNIDLAKIQLSGDFITLPTTYSFDKNTAYNLYNYIYYLLKTLNTKSIFKNNKKTYDFQTKPVTYSWALRKFFEELEKFICDSIEMTITLLSEINSCLNELYCNFYNGIQIKEGPQNFPTDITDLINANQTINDENIYRSLLNYRNKYVTQYIWYFLNQSIICSLYTQKNSLKFANLRIFELVTQVFYYLNEKIVSYPFTGYTDSDVLNYYSKKYKNFDNLKKLVFDNLISNSFNFSKCCSNSVVSITPVDYNDYNILSNNVHRNEIEFNNYDNIKNKISEILHRSDKARCAWIRKLGIYMVKNIEFRSQDQVLFKSNSRMMDIYYTNNLPIGKQYGFDKMICNIPEYYTYDSTIKGTYEIVVPLFYSFCNNPESTIPIVSSLMEYTLKIQLADLSDVFYTDGLIDNMELKKAYVMAEYFYINSEERSIFAKNKLEYLITEYEYDIEYRNGSDTIDILNDFPNLAANYYLTFQPLAHIDPKLRNIHSNYFPNEKQYSNLSLFPLFNLDRVRRVKDNNYNRILSKLNDVDDKNVGYTRVCNLLLLRDFNKYSEKIQLLKDKLMEQTPIQDYTDFIKLKELVASLPIQYKIYYQNKWQNKVPSELYNNILNNQINLFVNDIYTKICISNTSPNDIFVKYYCVLYYWKSRDGIYEYMIQEIMNYLRWSKVELTYKTINIMTKNLAYNLIQDHDSELAMLIDNIRYEETFKIKKCDTDYSKLVTKNKFVDIMRKGQITMNGELITPECDSVYFDSIVPYKRYVNSVGKGIYCYSWQIKRTGSYQPMGHLNLAKVNDFLIKCKLNTVDNLVIEKYVEGINILRYISGLCGKAWTI